MRAWVVESPEPIDSGPLRRIERDMPEPGRGQVRAWAVRATSRPSRWTARCCSPRPGTCTGGPAGPGPGRHAGGRRHRAVADPALDYGAELFEERRLRSVTANTRPDGEEFLRLAVRLGVRATTTAYPMDGAPRALADLAHGRFGGTAVLVNP